MNGENSEWLEVTSGVPQGSVLGPLHFILYINDIVEVIQCDLEIFADDTKLYSIIETIHDIVKLQHDLDNLQDWSRPLLLNLNFDKCKVMHIGKTPHSNYHVSDTTALGVLQIYMMYLMRKILVYGLQTRWNLAVTVRKLSQMLIEFSVW